MKSDGGKDQLVGQSANNDNGLFHYAEFCQTGNQRKFNHSLKHF